jgi:hypothetical protein
MTDPDPGGPKTYGSGSTTLPSAFIRPIDRLYMLHREKKTKREKSKTGVCNTYMKAYEEEIYCIFCFKNKSCATENLGLHPNATKNLDLDPDYKNPCSLENS